jgi:hypothetical protein
MEDNRKQIVFVEPDAMDMQAKMARLFRERGYETVLVTITDSSSKSDFILKSYDKIINFNFKFFRINSKELPKIALHFLKKSPSVLKAAVSTLRLKPSMIITRGPPNWFCMLIKKLFKNYPVVYYPYDIRSHTCESLQAIRRAGVKIFEIRAEKECFKKMDGIIHKGGFDELENLNTQILGPIKITCPTYHLLPYTTKELIVPINKNKLSRKDKEIHVVYAGCILDDKTFVETVEELLRQKIHLHMYVKHSPLTREEWLNTTGKDYKKFESNPYYHMHHELGQKELTKEISKYDYAAWLGLYDSKSNTIKYGMGNKFSTYLEAGLPLIHFKSHEYIWSLTKKYGTGIGVDFEEFKNLRKVIKKLNYKKMEKNIEKTREQFELEKHIPEIEEFFKKVRDYKYKSR